MENVLEHIQENQKISCQFCRAPRFERPAVRSSTMPVFSGPEQVYALIYDFDSPARRPRAGIAARHPRGCGAIFRVSAVRFECIGATGLTVRGSITGRNYRFNQPGEQVVVDSRDAPSMLPLPRLRPAR